MHRLKASRRMVTSYSPRVRRKIAGSASAAGGGGGEENGSSSYIDAAGSGHEIDNNSPDGDMDAVLHARSKFRRVLCANRGEIAVRVFRGMSIRIIIITMEKHDE